MDNIDRQILNELQNDFPLTARPYDIIAEKLGMDVEALWERITALIDSGVIRRIGASLDSNRLGFKSTLATVSVSHDRIEQAAEIIGRYTEVTHSYLRDDHFNIWFAMIAKDKNRITEILEEIRIELSLDSCDILNLPAERFFKLDARFNATKQ